MTVYELRANAAAVELLGSAVPLVGLAVTHVIGVARRERTLDVQVRWLRQANDVLRLYVIHAAEP